MSRSSVERTLGPMEVKRVAPGVEHRSDVANKVGHDPRLDEIPLEMARMGMGAAIGRGIGGEALKAYGDPGSMSKVVAGEKVPDYLAKLYANEDARQRFALALLEGIDGVEMETTVRISKKGAA